MANEQITVTTVKRVPSGSKNVQCDAQPAVGNVIFLALNTEYDITFVLGPGNVPEVTSFDSKKPFCNQPNNCPPKLPGGTIQKPCTLSANLGTSITIHIDASKNKCVTYYRLNFNDGYTWDPIIIHE